MDPVNALLADFDFYLSYFRDNVAPTWRYLDLHRQTILYRQAIALRGGHSALEAITDRTFMASLRGTLVSTFAVRRRLHDRLAVNRNLHRRIQQLDGCSLEDATPADLKELWYVIEHLKINDAKAKLVVNTKALAHVLTKLVVPIDRTYTGAFLFRFAREFDGRENEKSVFFVAYSAFQRIAHAVDLERYISTAQDDWNTTRPKVVDNAVIGFVQYARDQCEP